MSTETTSVNLASKIAIYVPARLDMTHTISSFIASSTGGTTILPSVGAWKQENGMIEYEEIDIVYSYHSITRRAEIMPLLYVCAELLLGLGESAVMIEHDGIAEIVSNPEVTT